jgi:catechol 2,3-dioxygenase-like lactoylglutathione lyase family enzyme
MDFKIELIAIPVSDTDRARDFYERQCGFTVDHDQRVSPELRFVQVTPPGSACSFAFGDGVIDTPPGSFRNATMVIDDAQAAYDLLTSNGVDADPPVDQGWGIFVFFRDPDGNKWALQQMPDWTAQARS